MKNLSQKLKTAFTIWNAGKFHPFFLYFSYLLFFASLFGLQDILVTPIIIKLLGKGIKPWLIPFFWTGLVLSVFTIWQYYRRWPMKFFEEATKRDVLIWLLLAIPFLALIIQKRIFLDFWLDEMMSIVRHIQPSLSSALTWYPVPNNHVFSNFIAGLYMQLLGRQDMQVLLSTPVVLRLLFFATGVGTILVLPYIGHRYIAKQVGWVSVILLCTTIPYFNFMVQARGYSFTLFFASLLLLSTLQYRESNARKYALRMMILACFTFYTISSNLYYLLALFAFFLLWGKAYDFRTWTRLSRSQFSTKSEPFVLINPGITAATMIMAGLSMALIFYIPIFDKVFGNRYVETFGLFRGTVFYDAFPRTMGYFFSGRGWLFVLAWLGVAVKWELARRNNDKGTLFLIHLLFFTIFSPYLFSFIRGDNPFERVFLITLPAFILLAAIGIDQLIQLIPSMSLRPGWQALMYIFVGVYLYGNFFSIYQTIDNEISTNLVSENIKQVENYDSTLWASHFLDHYAVLPVIQQAITYSDEFPILLDLENTRFSFTIEEYLKGYEVAYQTFNAPSEITVSQAYIIVSYPNTSLTNIQDTLPGAKCELIENEISIYRALQCQFPSRQ